MSAEQFLVADQHFTKPLTEREKQIYIDNVIEYHIYVKRMVEFAKYHVQEALMAANLEVRFDLSHDILNSYPLDQIK